MLFGVYQRKMVNCVSTSAEAQHIEAPISANNIHLNSQSRFCCQDLFFTPGLQFQASLSIAHRYGLSWIFLKVGFDRITCRAEGTGPKADVSGQRSKTEGGTCRAEEIEGGSSALGDEDSS